MAYPDRPGSEDYRERDWIRDERRRARGAYGDDDRDDIRRSYDYQAAERERERDYDRDRRYAAPRPREREYGSRGYIPYGVTGPTNYGGGYSGEIDHRPGDIGRAYAGSGDYERYGAHEIPRGHYLGDTDGDGRDYTPNPRGGRGEEVRTWWDRTTDEVAAMLGDRDAKRRRQWDEMRAQARPGHGQHRGRGPQGYRRSDERIREDVSDRLTDDAWLDASYIEVQVADGEVTLSGLVQSRGDKRRAEDIADSCSGVGHVQNNLRVRPAENEPTYDRNTLETGGTAAAQATTTTSGRA